MPRNCTVCAHPQVGEINAALFNPRLSLRRIAKRYGVHDSSLFRHNANCVAGLVRQHKELRAMLSSEELAARLLERDAAVERVLKRGELAGDDRLVLMAVREGRGNIEVYSRIGPLADIEERLTALEEDKDKDA
jgi:transposase-like protein